MILYIPNHINESMQEHLLAIYTKAIKNKAQELYINAYDLDAKISSALKSIINDENNANTYFGIALSSRNGNFNVGLEYAMIDYEKIPNDLFQPYQTLTHNYNNRNKKDYKLNISNRVFHIETQDKTNEKYHTDEAYIDNATQHFGKDIDGIYFILNLNFSGFNAHSIIEITKILYFYQYLYHNNQALLEEQSKTIQLKYETKDFLKEHSVFASDGYTNAQKLLEYCNLIVLSIDKILYQIELRKVREKSKNDVSSINPPKNPLYAIIEQRLFEATLKTKEKKFDLKEDGRNLIEAILYLQNNAVFIKILEENTIQNIHKESELALLFAIHEESFFITADELNQPIITKANATSLMGYKTPKIVIFYLNNTNDNTLLIECLKKETLKFYPKIKNNEKSIQAS